MRLFLLAVIALLVVSCSKTNESSFELLNIDNFDHIGALHNEYLEYANIHFPKTKGLFGKNNDEMTLKLEIIKSYDSPNSNLEPFNNPELNEQFIIATEGDILNDKRDELQSAVDKLVSVEYSAEEESRLTFEFYDKLQEAEDLSEVENIIAETSDLWNQMGYTEGSTHGVFLASTISVAKHTYKFWNNNEEALKNIHNIDTEAKFWWIVGRIALKDVIGGAAGVIADQALGGCGEEGSDNFCSGERFANAFVGGAVTSSLGL